MKRILVPTDFSETAQNATSVAIKLAQKLQSTIHLYSCLRLPNNWNSLTAEQQQANAEAQATITQAKTNFKAITDKFPEVNIETSFTGGNLINQIQASIELHNIDFIVMGSHGSSGISEFFIGSNTQKVVRRIHLPILVIKQPITDINFDQIVYASSFNMNEKRAFLKFKELVLPFTPVIHLLGIRTSAFLQGPASVTKNAMEQFKRLAAPLKCRIHIFKHSNVETGIRVSASKIGGNLIAISNQNRSKIQRIFIGSQVEALINHSDLPVLSIDFKVVRRPGRNSSNA